jgi:hypothetical protein
VLPAVSVGWPRARPPSGNRGLWAADANRHFDEGRGGWSCVTTRGTGVYSGTARSSPWGEALESTDTVDVSLSVRPCRSGLMLRLAIVSQIMVW